MVRNIVWLALSLTVAVGCADTWGRESAVEVPLHRDLMELPQQGPCDLSMDDWEKYCGRAGSHPDCPRECINHPPRGQNH
jgi:hypothetical protein